MASGRASARGHRSNASAAVPTTGPRLFHFGTQPLPSGLSSPDYHRLSSSSPVPESPVASQVSGKTGKDDEKDSAPKPRYSIHNVLKFGTKVIAVRVGVEPNHTDFTVHENLLRNASPFFDAALDNEWIESQKKMVKLPDCYAYGFSIYVQWLYTGRLHTQEMHAKNGELDFDKHPLERALLQKTYLLGDYLQDIDFKDTLMDAMIDLENEGMVRYGYIASHAVESIYKNTKESSPLRRLLRERIARSLMGPSAAYLGGFGFPPEFLAATITTLTQRIRTGQEIRFDFLDRKYCQYHCHGERTCYRSKTAKLTNEVEREVWSPLMAFY